MFMTEYTDKRDELYSAIERNRILCRKNKTSPEYHRLRKEQKTLKKNLEALENQYWR